jgi:hypothetical protein
VTVAARPVELKDKFRQRWFGDRSPYSDRLSRATVGFRVLVGLVALTLLTVVLGLANLHPIQRVKDQVGHIRGTGKVAGLTAASQPAVDPPDPTASWAVDHVRARGWATEWTAASAGNPETRHQADYIASHPLPASFAAASFRTRRLILSSRQLPPPLQKT